MKINKKFNEFKLYKQHKYYKNTDWFKSIKKVTVNKNE